MNKTILIVLAVVIVGLGAYALWGSGSQKPAAPGFDPLNATYIIEGRSVALANGKAEVPAAPGSATKIATTVFGQPVSGDLNGDGKPDAAVLLVQNPGGSGTFYYAAGAINTDTGAQGTNAVLLGDRVAPQNVEISNGQIIANYADRNPGEPMSTPPSLGVSKYLMYNGSMLVAVVGPGENCGGNMTTAPVCGTGYHCAPRPGSHLPFGDVGGTCVHN